MIDNIKSELSSEISIQGFELSQFMNEVVRYIQYIVYQLLKIHNGDLNQFKIFNELSDCYNIFDIFTLNHDLLIESYFKENNIYLNDGFVKSKKIRVFNNEVYSKLDKYNLFKLHGSIDWFMFQDIRQISNLYQIPLDYALHIDSYYTLDKRLYFTDGMPIFLIGTFNKMYNYLSGVFEVIFDCFKSRLIESDRLVVSGYGFGDKGVNTRISHFLKFPDKELIIIHPNKKHLTEVARGHFHIFIQNNPKVRFIEKKFEDISSNDINYFFS